VLGPTLDALGMRGDRVSVHTDMQVSENDMRLIGFASGGEREWFRLLTGVQGVGSKMALAVLSALTVDELQRACAGGRCGDGGAGARRRAETGQPDRQ
jgi:Holliday junction DNA helicase RuvA